MANTGSVTLEPSDLTAGLDLPKENAAALRCGRDMAAIGAERRMLERTTAATFECGNLAAARDVPDMRDVVLA